MMSKTIHRSLGLATLIVSISASAAAQGPFGLASQNVAPTTGPAGTLALVGGSDSCASPEAIGGTGTFAYDTTLATTGTQGQSEALCSGFGGSGIANDVWFAWTASFTGTARVSTCGLTTDDTKLAAYSGSGCPLAGSALACDDDTCGVQSTVEFSAVSGSTYTLQLGHFPGSLPGTGSFSIAQVQAPTCGQPHDGVSEDSVGLALGGDLAYLVYNDCMSVIDTVEVAFGSKTGASVPNGAPATIAIWNDPNDDGDPSDAVLIGAYAIPGGVVNSGTDFMNSYSTTTILGAPYPASGGTFVGVVVTHLAGAYAGPIDTNVPVLDANWLVGNTAPGTFDFNALTHNDVLPQLLEAVTPGNFLLSLTGSSSAGDNQGTSLCDGSGGNCPCAAVGAPGAGCPTSTTSGAVLSDTGNAQFSNDTYGFAVAGVPGVKPGLIFKGSANLNPGINTIADSDGLLCTSPQLRGDVVVTDALGTATITAFQAGSAFGATANSGSTTYYQFWFRDPPNPCTPATAQGQVGFNFSNMIGTNWIQ